MRFSVVIAVVLACSKSVPTIQISKPSQLTVTARHAIAGDVTALVFGSDPEVADQVVGYLEDVGAQAGRAITVRELDPLTDVREAQMYGATRDTVVLLAGERHERVHIAPRAGVIAAFDHDVGLALEKLGRVTPTYELVVTGDPGEKRYEGLKLVLGSFGYKPAVPAQLMIVIDSGTGSPADAIAKVDAHVAAGGTALVALEPIADRSLGALGARLGISYQARPVLDDQAFVRLRSDASDHQIIATTGFASHAITTMVLRANSGAAFPTTGSLAIERSHSPPAVPIVRTMTSAFVDTDRDGQHGANEPREALAIAAASGADHGPGRVVVFADADWLSDLAVRSVAGNQGLLVGALRWLGDAGAIDEPTPVDRDAPLTSYPARARREPAAPQPLWDEAPSAITAFAFTSGDHRVTVQRGADGFHARESRAGGPERAYPLDPQEAGTALAALARPIPARALGVAQPARLAEYGLDHGATLVVTGRASHELDVGGRVYGGSARYVRDRATGEVYVVEASLVQRLEVGEATLAPRSVAPFVRADVTALTVARGATRRALAIGDPLGAAPGSLQSVADRILALVAARPLAFVADAEAGPRTTLAHMSIVAAGRSFELELQQSSTDPEAWYVRGPFGLARVRPAQLLVDAIDQALAAPS